MATPLPSPAPPPLPPSRSRGRRVHQRYRTLLFLNSEAKYWRALAGATSHPDSKALFQRQAKVFEDAIASKLQAVEL